MPARRWIVFACMLCVACAVGVMLWKRTRPQPKITDQALLQEAVEEWRRAGARFPGPDHQIFEQQAGQGYYDDAMATARLFERRDDQHWSVGALARIRAENGDAQGAKAALKDVVGSEIGNQALREIAAVQASRGDINGALATIAGAGDPDDVRTIFARRQLERGDFDGALQAAEQMKSESADQFFYEVGDALRVRGEQKRVRELASHMTDRRLASEFLKLSRLTLYYHGEIRTIQAGPCEMALFRTTEGKFVEADELVERNNCVNMAYVAIRRFETDPVAAEHLLRSRSDSQNLMYGLGQFAVLAAQKGNIEEALRFHNELESRKSGGFGAVHEIARAWTIRDGPDVVLRWARSRPTTEERTWALIGMAEALGHPRPNHEGFVAPH